MSLTKTSFGTLISLLCILTFSFASHSTIITNTVIVGDKEWAQPSQFEGLGYDYIKEFVCPEVLCTGVARYPDGREIDLNGWRWASIGEVKNLFDTMIPELMGADVLRVPSLVYNWGEIVFDNVGFIPTEDDAFFRSLSGVTSTVVNAFAGNIAHGNIQVGKQLESCDSFGNCFPFIDIVDVSGTDALIESGAWFYRAAPTINASSSGILALFMMGLSGLLLIRNRRI